MTDGLFAIIWVAGLVLIFMDTATTMWHPDKPGAALEEIEDNTHVRRVGLFWGTCISLVAWFGYLVLVVYGIPMVEDAVLLLWFYEILGLGFVGLSVVVVGRNIRIGRRLQISH